MKETVSYNVLMSVYYKENPDFLKAAAESMLNQTIKPKRFILVCDGKLTPELDAVIVELDTANPDIFRIVRLPENKGLSNALNNGLKYCDCEYIARMDSDDISLPDRVEKQLSAMQAHNADICSCIIEEFDNDPNVISSTKTLPETNDDILKYARQRNPFNHPCVIFKKSAVEKCGCYEEYPFFEDYQLWLKMLSSGYKGYNLQIALHKMRTGAGMYKRRGGIMYFKYAKKLEKFKRSIKFSTRLDYFKCICAKFIFSIIPSKARAFFYPTFLRK